MRAELAWGAELGPGVGGEPGAVPQPGAKSQLGARGGSQAATMSRAGSGARGHSLPIPIGAGLGPTMRPPAPETFLWAPLQFGDHWLREIFLGTNYSSIFQGCNILGLLGMCLLQWCCTGLTIKQWLNNKTLNLYGPSPSII